MRRWFIAFLALLLTAQLSWAGAALCCVDELAEQTTALLSGEAAEHAASAETQAACPVGHCHCHHASVATPLAEVSVSAAVQHLAPEPARAARRQSHIPSGLERPNWLRA